MTASLWLTPQLEAKPNPKSAKNRMLEKALAENALFKCAANSTLESQAEGKALDKAIEKSCATQVRGLDKWYKGKEKTQRAGLLISNGKKSAMANRRFL